MSEEAMKIYRILEPLNEEARTILLHEVGMVICLECGSGSLERPNYHCPCRMDD